jgi:hypothetical protein
MAKHVMRFRIRHEALKLGDIGAILTFTDHTRLARSLRKHACPSLIAMYDTDLEGIVVQACFQGTAAVSIFFPDETNHLLAFP